MKIKRLIIKGIILVFVFYFSEKVIAQNVLQDIKIINEVPCTSIKNQARSGTCWSFGTTSFIESELIRMGKGEFDLSEMFTIRCTYEDHAKAYVRDHGYLNFGSGTKV